MQKRIYKYNYFLKIITIGLFRWQLLANGGQGGQHLGQLQGGFCGLHLGQVHSVGAKFGLMLFLQGELQAVCSSLQLKLLFKLLFGKRQLINSSHHPQPSLQGGGFGLSQGFLTGEQVISLNVKFELLGQ